MSHNRTEEPRDPFHGFSGYSSPNYTQVPDQLFDEHLADLSGAELKALLYIIRRTFGFKKESDSISLSQMLTGITTKDGRVLDRGTGLSRSSLVAALKGLAEKRLIIAERRTSQEKGYEATVYRLHVADPSTKIELGWSENRTRLVRKSNIQETERQETEGQQTDLSSNGLEGDISQKRDRKPSFSRKRDISKNQSQNGAIEQPQRAKREAPAPIGELLGSRVHIPVPDTPSERPRSPRSDFSDHPGTESHPKPKRGRPPKATEQIEALISQFSGEFHDEDSERPNISQAARLWKASGLSEDAFCQRLFEARSITKRYDIEKRAEGEAGKYGARNKMPYYFVVLRDLLGMREDTDVQYPAIKP